MSVRRVLVVEDDSAIRRGIVDALRFAGFEPLEAVTFDDAVAAATRGPCDLMLLDLVLPGGSGLDVMAHARRGRPTLPVIILTALGQEDDRVHGLARGADDYVVKPFSVRELLARVDAVMRRTAERPADVTSLDLDTGTADLARREARFADGRRVELSEKECELLRYLAAHRGRAVSRDELLERVWRLSSTITTRTIDMTVMRLREKLGDDGEAPKLVLTVRGKGYMLGSR